MGTNGNRGGGGAERGVAQRGREVAANVRDRDLLTNSFVGRSFKLLAEDARVMESRSAAFDLAIKEPREYVGDGETYRMATLYTDTLKQARVVRTLLDSAAKTTGLSVERKKDIVALSRELGKSIKRSERAYNRPVTIRAADGQRTYDRASLEDFSTLSGITLDIVNTFGKLGR